MKRWMMVVVVLFVVTSARAEENAGSTSNSSSQSSAWLGNTINLEKIVISPSGFAEPFSSASTSISVVDQNDFERGKMTTVRDALKDQVGVDVRQTGAFQGITDLMIRGGKTNHTLVLIDGVRAFDPSAPGGEYNITHLTLDNVDRIEILRGPQSALYGSDAMSGVVNISSRKAEKTYVDASFEGGSFYTYTEQFDVGSVAHGFHYNIAGSRLDTKGISQADAKHDCQERDPYDRTCLAGRADYDINDKISIGGTTRWTKAHFSIDQGANADDDNATVIFNENISSLFADQEITDKWRHSVRLGWMQTMRQYFDDDSPVAYDFTRGKYSGSAFTLNYESVIEPFCCDTIVIGYEYNEQMARYYSLGKDFFTLAYTVYEMPKVFEREGDFYLENRVNIIDKLTTTQGMRVSHNSQSGTHLTYRLDGSYALPTNTKFRGMVATGFKNPSLYQLNAPADAFFGGGNPNLKPEKSFSYEYGLDQSLFDGKACGGITYFHTLYTNLIDALTDPTTFFTAAYTNVGKAQVHGIEVSGTLKVIKQVDLTAGYTYQKTFDYQNDQEMIRRPENKYYVECLWRLTKKLSIDGKIRYNGPMSDNTSSTTFGTNSYKDKAFVVVNGIINYDLNNNLSLYVRADNVFNKTYEEVMGYGTPPYSMYGGVKAKF